MSKRKHHQKEAYYFSHDSNSRHDPKILALRLVYDYQGYGWYFAIVEILREQQEYKYDISLPFSWNALASELNTTPEKIKTFIDDCIHTFKLFNSDENFFWSESLNRRMKEKEERTKTAKKAALASWEKRKKNNGKMGDANALQLHSNSNAIKGKERKINKGNGIDDEPKIQFFDRVYMTNSQYGKLMSDLGTEKALLYMQKLNGYMGSKGINYDSHYDTIVLWSLKDNENQKQEDDKKSIEDERYQKQLRENEAILLRKRRERAEYIKN